MAKKNCFTAVKEALGDKIDPQFEKQYDELTRAYLAQLERIADGNPTKADFLKKARQLQKQYVIDTGRKKKILLESKKKEISIDTTINQFEDKEAGVTAILGGSVFAKDRARYSVDSISRATTSEFGALLENSLQIKVGDAEINGLKYLKNASVKQQRNIAIEIYELRKGGTPGKTGDLVAKEIAKNIKEVQQYMLYRIREAGGDIGEIDDYIFQQSHNADTILGLHNDYDTAVGMWAERILPLLDRERTFGPGASDEQIADTLRNVADRITGRSDSPLSDMPDNAIAILSDRDLAKNPFKSRFLHFKDGDAFQLYNQKFGQKDMFTAIAASTRSAGRVVGLYEILGPDPEGMFKKILKKNNLDSKTGRSHRTGYKGMFHNIFNASPVDVFKEVSGITTRGSQSTIGQFGAGFRGWQSMSKLGGAAIASANDLSTAGVLVSNRLGKNMLEVHSELLTEFASMVPPGNRKEWAKKMGLVFDDFLLLENARFGSIDSLGQPGWSTKMQHKFFQMNGLSFQTQTARLTVGRFMNREIAEVAGKPFNELTEQLRATFRSYGISEEQFGKLKNFIPDEVNGFRFIDEEMIREADLDLYKKWQVMMYDVMHAASPEPDAKTRAFFLRGHQADDVVGQVLRMIYQFKGVPTYLAHTVVPMSVAAKKPSAKMIDFIKDPTMVGTLAKSIAAYTAVGYMTLSLKDMVNDREPRSLRDPKTWADAMVYSGAAGLYGDFLLGEMHRYGGGAGVLKSLAGPGVSEAVDAAAMMKKVFDDAPDNPRGPRIVGNLSVGETLRFAQRNTPFANLFYTRMAVDNLVMRELHETLNAGEYFEDYMQDKQKRAREKRRGIISGEEGQGPLFGE